jgi:hypothetical protein
MAVFRALVLISGVTSQIASANVLSTGAGITTDAGNLSLTAAGAALAPDGAKNWAPTAGAGSVDLSTMTGTFKTSTGACTIGPGAIGISGLPTFQAGLLASGAVANDFSGSTGTFKTSTGAVTIGPGVVTVSGVTTFSAAGTALTVTNNALVSGNLTVTGTLTAGSFLSAGTILSGLTTAAMAGGAGQIGYASAASTLTPTDNATLAKSGFFGVFEGTAGQAQASGLVTNMQFTTAGGSPTDGSPVYLAAAADDGATGAGKATATAPSTVGSVLAQIGICIDNAAYAGSKTSKVLLQPTALIQL